jgi:hypothetical protein
MTSNLTLSVQGLHSCYARRVRALGLIVSLVVTACGGADSSDLLDDASAADGQTDARSDSPSSTCSTDAGACDVPAGWVPVAYASDTKSPCPTDFGAADDVLADPVVGASACACSCTKTQDPDCETGTSNWSGVGATCSGFAPYPLNFSGGKCRVTSGTVDDYDKATAIAPSGGTCTVTSVADNGAISGARSRICAADTACSAAVCGGYAPAGFTACIVSDGDVACPASSVFSVKHTVATKPTVQCSDCGAACTFQGSCTNPQLSFYSNQTCSTLIVSIPADGTCDATGHFNAVIGGTTYTATPSFTGCTATGTSTGTLQLNGPRTVCCHP